MPHSANPYALHNNWNDHILNGAWNNFTHTSGDDKSTTELHALGGGDAAKYDSRSTPQGAKGYDSFYDWGGDGNFFSGRKIQQGLGFLHPIFGVGVAQNDYDRGINQNSGEWRGLGSLFFGPVGNYLGGKASDAYNKMTDTYTPKYGSNYSGPGARVANTYGLEGSARDDLLDQITSGRLLPGKDATDKERGAFGYNVGKGIDLLDKRSKNSLFANIGMENQWIKDNFGNMTQNQRDRYNSLYGDNSTSNEGGDSSGHDSNSWSSDTSADAMAHAELSDEFSDYE